MRLVRVQWVDSARMNEWTYERPKDAVPVITSVGWLLLDGDHQVAVAPHVSGEGDDLQHVGTMLIPRQAIISITTVEEPT